MQIKAQSTVAVFGGSFNPFHEGHLGIVRALAADAEIDRVLVVPARRSPFKEGRPFLPEEVRWEMLRRGLRGVQGVILCDLELRRAPPSYTVDTLQILSSLLPSSRLSLVLGWDAFLELAEWHQSSEILRLANLTVFNRAGTETAPCGRWEELAERLPPPWNREARPDGKGGLVNGQGSLLLRRIEIPLPDLSARKILRTRSLDGVPEGAREVLEAYWRRNEGG